MAARLIGRSRVGIRALATAMLAAAFICNPLSAAPPDENEAKSSCRTPLVKAPQADIDAPLPDPVVSADAIDTGIDTHRRITIPVLIGGNGPHRFLVDTGSERTVVSSALARRLGLISTTNEMLISIVNRQQVAMVELPPLWLGRNVSINLNTPVLQSYDIGADGILGLDSLADKRVEIQDFGRCLQIFGSEGENKIDDEGEKFRLHAQEKEGQLIISSADTTGFPIKTVIDTGAEMNIGNFRLLRLLKTRGGVRIIAQREITGVTGATGQVQIGYIDRLTIGDAVMRNLAVAFIDSPALERLGLADKPTLIVGMNTLSSFERILIDFPEREITFVMPSARISPKRMTVARPYGT